MEVNIGEILCAPFVKQYQNQHDLRGQVFENFEMLTPGSGFLGNKGQDSDVSTCTGQLVKCLPARLCSFANLITNTGTVEDIL